MGRAPPRLGFQATDSGLATYYNAANLGSISGLHNPVKPAIWVVALVTAVMLLVPVVFAPGATDTYILPRTALVLTSGFALLVFLRVVEARLRWPLVAVGAAAVVSALLSVNPLLSLAGAYTRYDSLPVRIAYVGLLAGGAALGSGRSGPAVRRWAATGLVVGASVCAAEAVWQAITHALARPDGNLGQANLLGVLVALALPLCVRLGLARWPWLLLLPLLGGGLLVSASRSGWLAALVGMLVMFAFVAPRPWRTRLLLVAGAAAAVALAVILVSPLRHLNADPGTARIGVWGDGVRMFLARPVAGWGLDSTGLVFGRFQSADWEPNDTFDRIHNAVLDLAATQGLIGLASAAWLAATIWLRAIRAPDSIPAAGWVGCCAAYVPWALLNFDWAPVTGLLWLAAGLMWAEVSAGGPSGLRDRSGSRESDLLRGGRDGFARVRTLALAGTGLGLAGFGLGFLPLIADFEAYHGRSAAAVNLAPWQAQYHRVHGERLGPAAAGAAELETADRLGTYDYGFYLELGDYERAVGRPDRARTAYRRAYEVYRFSPLATDRLKQLGG